MKTSATFDFVNMAALFCLSILLNLACHHTIQANPSAKNPTAALDVHATIPAAKEVAARLYGLANEIDALRHEIYKIQEDPERFPIRELMQFYGKLMVGRLEAQHLLQMGEPAGRDLDRKFEELDRAIKHFSVKYGRTPRGQKLVAKQDVVARKLASRFPKIAAKAMDLATSGKVDASEAMLLGPAVELYRNLAPLNVPYDKPFQDQFITPFGSVMARIGEVRTPKYRVQATETIAALVQSSEQFSVQADAVIAEYRKGIAAADRMATQASQEELLKHWAVGSTQLVRANAIAYAFGFDRSPGESGWPAAVVSNASAKLQQSATAAHVALVDAAVQGAEQAVIPLVYSQFVVGISKAQNRTENRDAFLEACKPSLAKLSGKSPAVAAQLASYQRATHQPLQWRERFAKQSFELVSKQFPDASSVLAAEVDKQPTAPPSLVGWASLMMSKADPLLVGKPISGGSARRLLIAKPFLAVASQGGHYLNVAMSQSTQDAVEDLNVALLVSDSHPPLSLDSASAVSAAVAHDYKAIGGEVVGVTLEPRVVRFATLPTAGYVLVPLGAMPDMRDQQRHDSLDAVCWRLDVKSTWLYHSHFLVTAQ
ncbi:hypothetical protein [Neorhodopirellula lusitana]|uniref:hypothetical protein n=1 Tax=Neorhodopirellula lusitana TaxID=445327 RepID=UPI00384EEA9E